MTSQRTRARMIERLRSQGIRDEVVLTAMAEVPRHVFVEEALASRAYEDVALPLGYGQTISSPYIVARMLEVLRGGKRIGRALEIGTGCGYQAAVLSRLAHEVYTVERVVPLAVKARVRLRELDVNNVRVRRADGFAGFPDAAPFDSIIVAAAATHVPAALLEQLVVGGRMVLPMGAHEQHLRLVERNTESYIESVLETVKFVPMRSGME
ncbi:MAG TPA: protein-L-isoaspartate(D-aspartate) O-methyltransferase [Burkholderiales bacterium]|nr:protein-L-isoaspartate(D-aspartate) O-methyltransferase [Burkholderiales bacterium]